MNQRQYENAVRDIVFKAIVVPMVILIGMYIAGSLIGSFFKLDNQFATIFAAAGGVPTVGYYFYRLWRSRTE